MQQLERIAGQMPAAEQLKQRTAEDQREVRLLFEDRGLGHWDLDRPPSNSKAEVNRKLRPAERLIWYRPIVAHVLRTA